jgi:hypothetical protein
MSYPMSRAGENAKSCRDQVTDDLECTRKRMAAPAHVMRTSMRKAPSRTQRRLGPVAVSAALMLVVLVVASSAAAAPRLRIAVGVERPQQLAFAEPPTDHTAVRALAQGVREACADSVAHSLRSQPTACKALGDVPESNICVDETTEHALTRQIECSPGDLTADAIDLSRSGCETSDCYEVEARKAGASHLLVVSGSWSDAGLTVAGRFIDLSDESVHPFSPTDFAPRYSAGWPRSEPQVLALLKWLARAQTGSALLAAHDADRAAGQGATPAPVAAPSPPAPELPIAPAPTPPDRAWLGWSLVGVGVAAGVGSVISWRRNGDLNDCGTNGAGEPGCRKQLHTIVPTIAFGVVAAGALVTGAVVLVREHQDRGGLTLFLHPTGVALGGRFQ